MDNLMMLIQGFSVVFSLENLLVCLLGAVLGLIVGAMPGIGSLAGVALLLPLYISNIGIFKHQILESSCKKDI